MTPTDSTAPRRSSALHISYQNAAIAVLLLVQTGDAAAYLDGSTGTLLVQAALALVGGLIVFVKNPIKTLKAWLERFKK